jgi:hypothetical protein
VVPGPRRAWQDKGEIRDDGATRGGGEKEKEESAEEDADRIEIEGEINDGPIQVLSPQNSADREPAEPARRAICGHVEALQRSSVEADAL